VSEVVLDTSAVLALLNDEVGGVTVAKALERDACLMSCVNVAEVVGRFAQRGLPEVEAKRIMLSLNLDVVALDFRAACRCGALRPATRPLGLSLGDRACLTLALERGSGVLTADRAWAELDLGVEIRVIR
jgi:PIN domain nuclease of toxin-antitoxin system